MDTKPQKILKRADLVKWQALEPKDADENWQALAQLVAHLDDNLVEIDSLQVFQSMPCRLIVFSYESAGNEKEFFYLSVTSDGQIAIGHSHKLDVQDSVDLHDFNPLWDEVVSVVVTRRHRFIGDRLDLWIVINRLAPDEQGRSAATFAYHGLISIAGKRASLSPSQDDLSEEATGDWQAFPAERLPLWLRTWHFVPIADQDPFSPPPEEVLTALEHVNYQSFQNIENLVIPGTDVCFSIGQNIHVLWSEHGRGRASFPASEVDAQSLNMGAWVRALAVFPVENTHRLGIAGCDDRKLVAFEFTPGGISRKLSYLCRDVPTAVSFMPVDSNTSGFGPDLLVAFHSGQVKRLAWHDHKHTWKIWDSLWRNLGIITVDQSFLEAEQYPGNAGFERRKAIIFRLITHLLADLDRVPKSGFPSRIKKLIDLFQPQAANQLFMASFQILLDALKVEYETHRFLPDGSDKMKADALNIRTDFLLTFLNDIYAQTAPKQILERIDHLFRNFKIPKLVQDPRVTMLYQGSQKNREMVWNENPSPEKIVWLVYHASFGLDRWADAYWESDLVNFGGKRVDFTGFRRNANAPDVLEYWLVAAGKEELDFHFLPAQGPLPGAKSERVAATRKIASLPDTGGHLILGANQEGLFHLYAFSPNSPTPVSVLDSLTTRPAGLLQDLKVCPGLRGETWVAAAYNRGRHSVLVVVRVVNGRLHLKGTYSSKLARVHYLDICLDPLGGIIILKASALGAPIRMCHLDTAENSTEAELTILPLSWELKTGASAVCFDAKRDAQFALAVERDGMVWCGRLHNGSEVSALAWTYRLKTAVRGLVAVVRNDKRHFLIGTEDGQLTLLEAQTGRRVWKHRFNTAVSQIVSLDKDGARVAIGLGDDSVALFDQIRDPEETMARLRQDLSHLQNHDTPKDRDLAWANHPSVQAVYLRIIEKKPYVELFKAFPERVARARLIRYLLTQERDHLAMEPLQSFLPLLSARDLSILLAYLHDDFKDWDEVLKKEIFRRNPRDQTRGDDGPNARHVAVVSWLQRFSRGHPAFDRVKSCAPPVAFLRDRWVCLEYARTLLQSIFDSEVGTADQPDLFKWLLPHLFHLPPSISKACVAVLPYESGPQKPFKVFTGIIEKLEKSQRPGLQELEYFAKVLHPLAEQDTLIGLLSALTDVFLYYRKMVINNGVWDEWRERVLADIRRLQEKLDGISTPEAPLKELAEVLRKLVPIEPLPGDTQPLKDRSAWMDHISSRLDVFQPTLPNGPAESWDDFGKLVIKEFAFLLAAIAKREKRQINLQVRPRLTAIMDPILDHNRMLRLKLRIEPEGGRNLFDVTLRLENHPEEGLISLDDQVISKHFVSYPGKYNSFEQEIQGFIRPEQKTIAIIATLEDETGFRSTNTWHFAVPTLPKAGRWTLPESLPAIHATFLEEVIRSSTRGVTFAVIDADLGQEAFVDDWRNRSGGLQIDLDTVLADTGTGRRYNARLLDLGLINEKVGQALEAGIFGGSQAATQAVLIGPINQLCQRLLVGEAPGLLNNWIDHLLFSTEKKLLPPLILVISSIHMCAIRELDLGPLQEIHVAQVARSVLGPESGTTQQNELMKLMALQVKLPETRLFTLLNLLAWDVRLILRWLRWAVAERARRLIKQLPEPDEFLALPETREFILAELKSLQPYHLLLALYGSETETPIKLDGARPGQFSARRLESTTRTAQRAKTICETGQPLTPHGILQLKSDRKPPDQIWILGFGLNEKTPVSSRRSDLKALVYSRSEQQRHAGFHLLASRGIGAFIGRIFVTIAPYQSFIRDLYDQAAVKPGAGSDTIVYQAIMGRDRFPLEAFSLDDLQHIHRHQLNALMPGARPEDINTLMRIGRFWAEKAEPEQLQQALVALFRAQWIELIPEIKGSWEEPLTGLGVPVYRIYQQARDHSGDAHWPADFYLIWLERGGHISPERIGESSERAANQLMIIRSREAPEADVERRPRLPQHRLTLRLVMMGPGVPARIVDKTKRVASLPPLDLLQATWEGDLYEKMVARIRAQLRLTALSPFQTSGALPPGSQNFVGREDEVAYIENHIRRVSILIVGSRRVGKTSLLNRIKHWGDNIPDLFPIFVDLQGAKNNEDFQEHLDFALRSPALKENLAHLQGRDIRAVAGEIQRKGMLPLFLLNEIDYLVDHEASIVEIWRGLNDAHAARFLMVGYSVIGTLDQTETPLFHFTQGPDFHGKAIALRALAQNSAKKLLDLLVNSDLKLEWASEEEREQAYGLFLRRSYCIPWVLQSFGEFMVERMEDRQSFRMTYDDVSSVLESKGHVVWDYIQSIDYGKIQSIKDTVIIKGGRKPGFMLILMALARKHYFLGGSKAPIRDQRLSERSSLSRELAFTTGEARDTVKETMAQLLVGTERQPVEDWFDALDIRKALRLLTLTLVLEPDPEVEDRFGFLLHIMPLELQRLYGERAKLENAIVEQAIEFMDLTTQ